MRNFAKGNRSLPATSRHSFYTRAKPFIQVIASTPHLNVCSSLRPKPIHDFSLNRIKLRFGRRCDALLRSFSSHHLSIPVYMHSRKIPITSLPTLSLLPRSFRLLIIYFSGHLHVYYFTWVFWTFTLATPRPAPTIIWFYLLYQLLYFA